MRPAKFQPAIQQASKKEPVRIQAFQYNPATTTTTTTPGRISPCVPA